MLKILQARLQQYVNSELPDVQAGFRKGRGTRDQVANIYWIIEKAREFQKNVYFCFIDYVYRVVSVFYFVNQLFIICVPISLENVESESVSCSVMSDSCDPMDCTHQAPLSMAFPRQEHWSGLPFPSPGDLQIFATWYFIFLLLQ